MLNADGSWSPLSQGFPNVVVLGLSQNPTTGTLVAATHGRGAFALGGGVTAPRLTSFANTADPLAPGAIAPGMTASLLGANLASA